MNAFRNRDALKGMKGLEEARDSAWTGGIGEIVEAADPVSRAVILANPGTGVSTKVAYEAMDSIGYSDKDRADRRLFVNDMESYTLSDHKKAAELKRLMQEKLSADEVLMSGSGPTIVAYYRDNSKASEDMRRLSELTRAESDLKLWLSDTGKQLQWEGEC
jgi:4-diphosphocytidyl-2-C-methyl-D-erythritol kinase